MITYNNYIRSLNRISDIREPNTKDHSRRVRGLALGIGKILGYVGSELECIGYGADIHDLGKVGISSLILGKAGKLNVSELAAVRKHPEIGWGIIHFVGLPEMVEECVLWHHLHWDGTGYPNPKDIPLEGDRVPIHANIVGICDVWDAITSARPYRPALTLEDGLLKMADMASWFSPDVYAAWLKLVRKNERT